MSQISFFDGSQPLQIRKPIRLIELFAGYGSQALALQDLRSAYGMQRVLQQTLYSLQEIWRPAISQGQGEIRVGQQIRVRKLTERETGRLMGVKDEDIDRIAQHQSKSSQYHLYGDSIVVPVLMAIFAPMFGKMLTEEHINEIYKE